MTQHLKEMINERIRCLPLDKTYVESLYKHILHIGSIYNGNMRILIDRLDDDIIKQDPFPHRRTKNEVWVVMDGGRMVTLYRRKEGQNFTQHLNRYQNIEYKITN
tara:strand:- start:814 stop:1128 length:315 start_codon:yes stop_codon:yes gene_type:complete